MLKKEFILEKLKQLKNKYNKEGFYILGIFGSYAKDTANNQSDIDILYSTQKGIENLYDKKQKLKQELQKIFHTKVDLASEKYLKSYVKDIIMKELIYVK